MKARSIFRNGFVMGLIAIVIHVQCTSSIQVLAIGGCDEVEFSWYELDPEDTDHLAEVQRSKTLPNTRLERPNIYQHLDGAAARFRMPFQTKIIVTDGNELAIRIKPVLLKDTMSIYVISDSDTLVESSITSDLLPFYMKKVILGYSRNNIRQ